MFRRGIFNQPSPQKRGLFGAGTGGRPRPWLVVLPALIVFVVTAGFRLMSPPGQWSAYQSKAGRFSVEIPGRPFLKQREYDAAELGRVAEARWNLVIGAGAASTEYFVLRLQLAEDVASTAKPIASRVLDATLASALTQDSQASTTFTASELGGTEARQLIATRTSGRTLTARAAFKAAAIVVVGVDAAPEGATVIPTPPKGSILQRLFARRNASAAAPLLAFSPEPVRFLSSFRWVEPG